MSTEERDYLWQHFEFNSEQRLKAFNFFVVLSVFANGGVFAAVEKDMHPLVFILIGLFIVVFSAVFWVMDIRSRSLLRLAIPGLVRYEESLPDHSRLFSLDAKRQGRVFRYTVAFRVLFALQLVFGISLAAFGLMQWLC